MRVVNVKKSNLEQLLFLIVLMFSFLLFMSIANAQLYIDPGGCAEENETEQVCCVDCPIVNVTENNITIWPGTYDVFEWDYCKANVNCELGNESSIKCKIRDLAEPGDDYRFVSDVCDVEIDIERCGSTECETELPTTISRDYLITYDEDTKRIEINFNNEEYIYSIRENSTGLTIKDSIEFTCPTVFAGDEVNASDILQQCKRIIPTYCKLLPELLIDKYDLCEDDKRSYWNDLNECRDTFAHSVCIESKAYADMKANCMFFENSTNNLAGDKGKLEYQNEDLKLVNSFQFFVIFILSGIIAVLGIRVRRLSAKPLKL